MNTNATLESKKEVEKTARNLRKDLKIANKRISDQDESLRLANVTIYTKTVKKRCFILFFYMNKIKICLSLIKTQNRKKFMMKKHPTYSKNVLCSG